MPPAETASRRYRIRRYAWLFLRVLIAAAILFIILFVIYYFGLRNNYTFHWAKSLAFLWRFNQGLLVTLQLSLLGAILAIALGLVVALMRLSPWAPVRDLAGIYVHTFRNLPFLVVILLFYFGLGKAIKITSFELWGGRYTPQFVWGVIALGVYESSYLGETFRAGIQSVHRTQVEAARSLGMGYFQLMRYVVLPQALRVILPPFTGTLIALIKESSLLYLISVQELTDAARQLIIPSRPHVFEFYTILAAYYLSIVVPLSLFSNWLESRLGISRAQRRADV